MARDEMRREELLSALIDGELSDEERREAEAMIAADPEAKALLEKLKSLSRATAEEPVPEVPAALSAKISTRVRQAGGTLVRPPRRRLLRPTWMTAAAGVAAAFVLGVLVFHQWQPPLIGKAPAPAPESSRAAAGAGEAAEEKTATGPPVEAPDRDEGVGAASLAKKRATSESVMPASPPEKREATAAPRRKALATSPEPLVEGERQYRFAEEAPSFEKKWRAIPKKKWRGEGVITAPPGEKPTTEPAVAPAQIASAGAPGSGEQTAEDRSLSAAPEQTAPPRTSGSDEQPAKDRSLSAARESTAPPGVSGADVQTAEGRALSAAAAPAVQESLAAAAAGGTKLACGKTWAAPARLLPVPDPPKDAEFRLKTLVTRLGGGFDRHDPSLLRIPKARWPAFLERLPRTGYRFTAPPPPPPKESDCIQVRLEKATR